jgi:ribosomal protein L11 methyltransferase
VDNDPEAIEVALENVALNHVDDQVKLLIGSIPDVEGTFDVVVSNIHAGPLVEMASDLTRRLKHSGRLVLSGILVEQVETVQAACEAQGLRLIGSKTAGEWCSPVFA